MRSEYPLNFRVLQACPETADATPQLVAGSTESHTACIRNTYSGFESHILDHRASQQLTKNLLRRERFKNFPDGSCGPYAPAACPGMHPLDAETIFSSKRTRAVRCVVQFRREITLRAGQTILDGEEAFGAFTGGGARIARVFDLRVLYSRGVWDQDVLKHNGYYGTHEIA